MKSPERIYAFLDAEMRRRDSRSFNLSNGAFTKLVRTLTFLATGAADYEAATTAFLDAQGRWYASVQAHGEGSRTLTAEEQTLYAESTAASALVHYRIETFYIWAKVLLDQVAQAIEHYFGRGDDSLRIDKHSRLRTRLARYLDAKGLAPAPDVLAERFARAHEAVVAFRDRHVVHDASPRTVKGTVWHPEEGKPAISVGRMFPTQSDPETVTSAPPADLLPILDAYVVAVVDYVEANHACAAHFEAAVATKIPFD